MVTACRTWVPLLALGTAVAGSLIAPSTNGQDAMTETESPRQADAGAPSATEEPSAAAAEPAETEHAGADASEVTPHPGASDALPGPPVAEESPADEPGPRKALGYRVASKQRAPSDGSATNAEGTEHRIRHALLWPGVGATVIGVPLTVFGTWFVSVSGGGSQSVNETGVGLLVPGIVLLVVGVPLIIAGAVGEDVAPETTAELLIGPQGLTLRGSL